MLAFSNDYYGLIFRATQSVELFCAYDACNEFLDNMQRVEVRGILYKNLQSDWEDLEYGVAMKKFRKIFRDNIKLLAETYNITFSKEIPKEY